MAGKGKPNFLASMAVLKGKVIKGLAPTGDSGIKQKKPVKKHIFGQKFTKDTISGKGNKKLPDVQNK